VPSVLGCTERKQDILILDFRSGWWAGGGGEGFTDTALSAVVGVCAETSVDYHHLETQMHVKCVYASAQTGTCSNLAPATTVADIMSSLQQPSVDDYTQIWVLSGSDQDPSDIPVGNALFQGILGNTTGSCIPMLLATGDGFITHANTVTQDLGMGTLFSAETNPPGFMSVAGSPNPPTDAVPATRISVGGHVLFSGVSSIVDTVTETTNNPGQQAVADALAPSAPSPAIYKVVANDGAGQPTIAVGASKLSGDNYRPFIMDSGWQRTYTLSQDPGTKQYLANIVMYLSLVGCKAAPIGTPQ
jgi:hypothetical protein